MTWTEVETYRQLEQEYTQSFEEFCRDEADYRAASRQDNSVDLAERYEQLSDTREQLVAMHDRLRQLRFKIARERDQIFAIAGI